MMRRLFILSSALLLAGVATAQPKYQKTDKGDFVEITQQGGRTLGYNQNSGIEILEVEGYAFKDLNRNGKLDKYEDWRLPSKERAEDLAERDVLVEAERAEDEQSDGDSAVGADGADAHAPSGTVEVEESAFQSDDGQAQQVVRPVEGAEVGQQ
jgi:beta-glucosidase